MALLRQLGMRRHHRSASAEMDLVMDFSHSGECSIVDQLPLPQALRRPDEGPELREPSQRTLARRHISDPHLMTVPDDAEPAQPGSHDPERVVAGAAAAAAAPSPSLGAPQGAPRGAPHSVPHGAPHSAPYSAALPHEHSHEHSHDHTHTAPGSASRSVLHGALHGAPLSATLPAGAGLGAQLRADNRAELGGAKTRLAMPPVAKDGGGASIQMSLVSPPFTPVGSQLDLSQRAQSPEPLKLPEATKAQVRARLDDTLPEVFCESRARIPTTNGEEIFLHVYRNNVDAKEHLAIVFGHDIHSRTLFAPREGETEHDRMTRGAYTGRLYPGRASSGPDSELPELQDKPDSAAKSPAVLCRIHSECYTGETAWSARCDCGEQLDEAARLMSEAGRGVIVYLRQEGRGIGLGEKLKAYNLQDLGADTVQANLLLRHPADGRTFGLATAILLDLGLDHIRLMTNNPDKIVAVEGKNKEITVTQRVPMIPLSWQKKGGFQSAEVDKYLATKIERMGHLLNR